MRLPDLEKIKKISKDWLAKINQDTRFLKELESFQQKVKKSPDNMVLLSRLAELYYLNHQPQNSVPLYEKIAKELIEKQKWQKALFPLTQILRIDPTRVDINALLARIYIELGQKNEAIIQYQIIIQHFGFLGKKDKLIQTSKKLIELDPAPIHQRKLGEIYQAFGMKEQALSQFEKLARHYQKNKQYEDLLKIYELIIPYKSKDIPTIKDMCILYLRAKEPDKALRLMERFELQQSEAFASLKEKAMLMKEFISKAG